MCLNDHLDITHLSDQELNALAYDTLQELERHQQNLQVIRAELAKRQERAAEPASAILEHGEILEVAPEEQAMPAPNPPLVTRRPPLILDGVFLVEDEAGVTIVTEAGEAVVLDYERKPLVTKKPPLIVG